MGLTHPQLNLVTYLAHPPSPFLILLCVVSIVFLIYSSPFRMSSPCVQGALLYLTIKHCVHCTAFPHHYLVLTMFAAA